MKCRLVPILQDHRTAGFVVGANVILKASNIVRPPAARRSDGDGLGESAT